MTDEADAAQGLEEWMREEALLEHKRKRGPKPGNGSLDCVRCGDPIPLARLQAVPEAEHCVGCQQDLEREAKCRVSP